MESNPKWVKKQGLSKHFKIIKSKKWDGIRDFVFDNGRYMFLKNYKKTKEIGVAICDYKHTISMEFRGKRAQDIYQTIFDYSIKHNKNWFTRLDHAAYLGKELKKAEICLAEGKEYVQE